MNIVTRKHLLVAATKYLDAASEIQAWFKIARESRWRNLLEVRQVIGDADVVEGFTIFNIRHNRYRLITVIHYAREKDGRLTEGHIYIRSFLTHREYDNRANWNQGVKP